MTTIAVNSSIHAYKGRGIAKTYARGMLTKLQEYDQAL